MPKFITVNKKRYKKLSNWNKKDKALKEAIKYRNRGHYATVRKYTSKFWGIQYGVYVGSKRRDALRF